MQRNFALDCFRALAIMLVFTGHTINSLGSPEILAPLQFGGTGVDLFFVLSGWLIGNQLFREQSKFGNIDISRFWIRRWMRTLPAYYAVLAVTIAQQYLTKDNFEFPWSHIFFTQNYNSDLNLFYVSWSLSVEEQFYLFIAPLLVVGFRLGNKVQVTALLILLLSPSFFRSLDLFNSLKETRVRLDCCAMGVLLAYLKFNQYKIWQNFAKYIRGLFYFSIALYIFYYVARYYPEWHIIEPSKLQLAIIFGIWIIWADGQKHIGEHRYHSIIMHISTRSYAMYLLHVDALAIAVHIMNRENIVFYYTTTLFITLVLSEVMYRIIEMPFINARKNFSFSKSREHNEKVINRESYTNG